MKYVKYILGIFTMLIGIPASEDNAVAGLTMVALVVIIVATVKYIEDYFKIKELSKKKGENEKELKSRKSKDKIRKRQLAALGAAFLGFLVLTFCTGGSPAKLRRIISSSFATPNVSEEYVEQSMETQGTEMATEAIKNLNKPSGQTESVQNKQEETRYYDAEYEIRLESIQELSESIDVQEREQQVFFGLLSEELGSGEQVYNLVKQELLGSIWMNRQSMLKRLSSEEQEEVLEITGYNDQFWENVEYVKENPPYYPGRSEWYRALPEVSGIFSIIQRQELQAKKSPDIELENQLFNNYWRLAREYKKQGWKEKKDIIFLQEQAAYHLLEKMEFEDISIDNVYKTIANLQEVYRAMEDENVSGADTEVGKMAEVLQESIERFIQEEISVKDISNDPIVMAGRK